MKVFLPAKPSLVLPLLNLRLGLKQAGGRMDRTRVLAAIGLIIVATSWVSGCAVAPLMHRGGIQVDRWAEVKADDHTVAEILTAFNRAEEALQSRNLDALMGLYSDGYSYHGLTKADLRKIWEELLAHYDRLSSNHIFSKIVVTSNQKPSAEITCTGSLWGISKETGQRENIDSWFGEVHHLEHEAGAWRVRGHKGEVSKVLQFGVAPHPFF